MIRVFCLQFYVCYQKILKLMMYLSKIPKLIFIIYFLMSIEQTTLITEQEGNGFYIAQFKTTNLAIFSYYVESEKSAYLIDPTFDTEVYRDFLIKRGSKLQYVLLTHYHADFVSGHTQFHTPIIMGQTARRNINGFQLSEMKDGSSISLGSTKTIIIHTPGHTPESSCFLLKDCEGSDVCLFSGDTVFLGDVGRPDLAVSSNLTREDLAGMLFDSVQKLRKLDGKIRLYPGHGSGSACGKAIGGGNFCTLGAQYEKNYGFLIPEKEEFIAKLTEGIQKPPSYFFHDAKTNQMGPCAHETYFKTANIPLSIEEFQKLAEKAVILDSRPELTHGLIKGSYWTHQKGPLCNFVSMIGTPDEPVLLVTEEGKHEESIQRLLRIGYFNIKGYNNFKVSDYPGEKFIPKIVTGKEAFDIPNRTHVDVRNVPEYVSGGVVEKALLVPLGEIRNKIDLIKDRENVFVNCKSGMRARFAYSILANLGVPATIIIENFENYPGLGYKVIKYEA